MFDPVGGGLIGGEPIGKKPRASAPLPQYRSFETGAAPGGNAPGGKSAAGNDDILFVGMNPLAPKEVDSVRKVTKGKITPVFSAKEQGTITITVQGKPLVCNLKSKAGVDAFASSLQLPPEQSAKIAALFEKFNRTGMEGMRSIGGGAPLQNRGGRGNTGDALDELAQIAQVWARAERGGQIPARMVLSGHGDGEGIFGEHNATLSLAMLGALAEAMPRAANQVEDLHVSACHGGSRRHVDHYRAMFPQVKTVFAYAESAPGTYSGVAGHLSRWEKTTRGRTNDLDRDIVKGMRKAENVAVWSAKDGYDDGRKLTDLQELRAHLATYDADFNAALDGTAVITDPGRGPVRAYYTALQALLGRSELPDDERASLEAKRDQTLRLLYFSKAVAPTFADHYKAELQAGYEAVGKQVPDFANLSRAAALIQINLFRWSLPKPSPEAANRCLELLTEGLQNLSPGIIPTEWL